MKYPGDISPEAYAAMEDGYEQGYAAGFAAPRDARRDGMASLLAELRERGGVRVTVGGVEHEVRLLLMPETDSPVLSLYNVALLNRALIEQEAGP